MLVLQGYTVTVDCLYVGGSKTKLLSTSVLIRLLCNSLCSATSSKYVFLVGASKSVIPDIQRYSVGLGNSTIHLFLSGA